MKNVSVCNASRCEHKPVGKHRKGLHVCDCIVAARVKLVSGAMRAVKRLRSRNVTSSKM